MSLQETEKKLYKKEESAELGRAGKPGESNPHISEENPFTSATFQSDLDQRKGIWIKEQEEKKEKRKKLIKKISLVAGALIVVAGIIWLSLFIRKTAFSEDQVSVAISGPEKVKSGELVTLEINFNNLNRASLKDAVLYINYSENFKPSGNLQFESEGPSASKFNVGDIAGKNSGKVNLQGKFFGPSDALVYLEARLEYKSSSFNSTFAAKANTSVFISSSPLLVEISGPQNAASGNAVSYTVSYQNNGQEDFSDLKIKADFPSGFSFSNSEPLPAQDNNIWYIGVLGAGQKGEIKINGTVKGEREEEKTMKISVGEIGADSQFISFGEAESHLKIIGSPIAISETINGKNENVVVNSSETLLFEIKYKNAGPVGLRDAILTVEAASPVLDYARIDWRDAKGEFDSEKKMLTWKASNIPNLRMLNPNEEGKLIFSIPVKEIIPVSKVGDKNYAFSAIARIDSPDIPTVEGSNKIVASNVVNVKLNSKILMSQEGFFNDSEISNSGPLPLKVGQETTFTLHAKLTNISNDITDGKVVVTLASGVKWKNNFSPKNAAVSFNDRTNEITWNVGSLSAGSGIVSDPKELVFQIGISPSQNQVGDFAQLISKSEFSAKDAFTGQDLKASLGSKTTNLQEDLGVGDGGKVIN